ncbi:MAG: ABC transporter substrate-binding protein [Lentisphaerae bacterium]|nr:ABC transporter substrate-binding protein [Lentisphaerota bacterium]
MWTRLLICAVLMGILLALPFYFRKDEVKTIFADDVDTVVVICAHNKTIRDEYEQAFRKWYKAKHDRDVRIDFRTPGGTSDITRYIEDRFRAEFRFFLEKEGVEWQKEYGDVFNDKKRGDHWARQKFLNSNVGIGIDVFAGGGTFEHSRMADRGYAVDGKAALRHPEWFGENAIPSDFGGDKICHPEGKYYGVVLSTFGILYNCNRINELKNSAPPERWSDLGDGRFFNTLVLADPTKSGSANKCYEIIIQQCMAQAGTPDAGWRDGLNLLKRIFANARTLTDSASRVVGEVGTGNAAAGTAIDTYGFTEVLWSEHCHGDSKVVYVMPKGGTAVGADPVQILRGAPNRKVAEEFVDFLLSIEGQKLHAFKAGTPGGPEKTTLSRAPVRRELYAKEFQEYIFKKDYNPYASGADFEYRAKWTGRYYTLLRQVIKALMLDPHVELQAAWQAIIAAGGPDKVPQAMAVFNALPFEYQDAAEAAKSLQISKEHSASDVAAVLRHWSENARQNYRDAERLAKEGK